MNQKVDRYMRIFLILLLLSVYFVEPLQAKAVSATGEATTLAELRQELKKLQQKKKNTENQKNMTKAEINKKNGEIIDARKEIEDAETKIEQAKKDIEASNKKIEEVNKQTEEVMAFYQIMSGENSYLEFITASSSITEMVMRSDAVNQIANYNKEKLIELEDLIKSNEQLQVDLKNTEKDLNQKILDNKNRIDALDSSLIQMEDIAMDIDEEISIVQTSIKMYEGMGCGENQQFSACAKTSFNSTWLKPVTKGMVTSLFGKRNMPGSLGNHSGIDVGVSEKTNVYSSTNGKVVYIIRRSSCGGNQVYVESVVNGTSYTMLYAHLYDINVSLGQTVTNQTIIGRSGGYSTSKSHGGYDRCTFGPHLHYSVSKSRWTTWSHFYANLINPPGFPGKGAWFYNRYQWFG